MNTAPAIFKKASHFKIKRCFEIKKIVSKELEIILVAAEKCLKLKYLLILFGENRKCLKGKKHQKALTSNIKLYFVTKNV